MMNKISAPAFVDPLDRRLNAYRFDLADIRLKGKVTAGRFVAAVAAEIRVPVADLKSQPALVGETCHQLLFGEPVFVFEQGEQWAWVQSRRDFYVGYVELKALEMAGAGDNEKAPGHVAGHVVCVPSTFLYPRAELKSPPIMALSMGSVVSLQGYQSVRGTKYAVLADGSAMIASHLCARDQLGGDYVAVCELLENVPYLWGGASGFGLDCAGMVQLAMRMSGREVLRDSDMQEATLGDQIDAGPDMENLRRGDLIFWRGHVALCQGEIAGVPHIIHASGHTMNVASEPLDQAIERIAHLYERPTGFKRCS
ncbi:NLP/P60 family lipoprotein [hydrothermal vent metagenome]|uniref:NLP/P60 family lipoprotein n=1 Tax=hydrothermal vent metagenome TaxID=652676 RepID=A0A3B0TNF2_9ZZZZ